jgi:hypothetical protein
MCFTVELNPCLPDVGGWQVLKEPTSTEHSLCRIREAEAALERLNLWAHLLHALHHLAAPLRAQQHY